MKRPSDHWIALLALSATIGCSRTEPTLQSPAKEPVRKTLENQIVALINANFEGYPNPEVPHESALILVDRDGETKVALTFRRDKSVQLVDGRPGLWDMLSGNALIKGTYSINGNDFVFVFPNCTDDQKELIEAAGFQAQFPDDRPLGELRATLTVSHVFDQELKLDNGHSCMTGAMYGERFLK